MANTYLLSDESKHYLCCYYQILDEMIQGITTAKLTQSISRNFIVQMIPHHRAAVRMSRNILEVSDDTNLRRLAQRIITRQSQGIETMESLVDGCGQLVNPQMDLRLYQRRMDLVFREMFTQMGAAPEGNRLNAVFLQQMILHHRGRCAWRKTPCGMRSTPISSPFFAPSWTPKAGRSVRCSLYSAGWGVNVCKLAFCAVFCYTTIPRPSRP